MISTPNLGCLRKALVNDRVTLVCFTPKKLTASPWGTSNIQSEINIDTLLSPVCITILLNISAISELLLLPAHFAKLAGFKASSKLAISALNEEICVLI